MKSLVLVSLGVLAASLAACGGGGGGGGTSPGGSLIPTATPTVSSTSTPSSQPTATSSPSSQPTSTATPTSTPTTSGTSVTGTVADYTSGAPIANATVIVGSTLVLGATPPPSTPSGDVVVTTNASGAFSANVTPTSLGYLMVFTSDGHAAFHAPVSLATARAFSTLKLSTPTADDLAWLAAINQDRATYGAQPVVFDELLLEATRLWGVYEANNSRAVDVDSQAPAPYATSITVYGSLLSPISGGATGNYSNSISQNGTGGSSGVAAEANLRSEGPTGPHFSTVISTSARWVGTSNAPTPGGVHQFVLDLASPTGGV